MSRADKPATRLTADGGLARERFAFADIGNIYLGRQFDNHFPLHRRTAMMMRASGNSTTTAPGTKKAAMSNTLFIVNPTRAYAHTKACAGPA